MTIHRVEVNEYECRLCGYSWINRVNGKDGPIPERCAKCERYGWDEMALSRNRHPMTPKEAGLRTRIKNLPRLYYMIYKYHALPYDSEERDKLTIKDVWDIELLRMFLTLDNPRPTVAELENVLYPPDIALGLDSQNWHRYRGMVPDPNRQGWLIDRPKEFRKVLDSNRKYTGRW
jgi:hypothetical protein